MRKSWGLTLTFLSGMVLMPALFAAPIGFVQTNLVSNQASVVNPANPDFKNAWGLAASSGSPWWIGLNGSGLSQVYSGTGVKQGVFATIPGDGTVTGVTFSGVAGSFNGDLFLFDSEDGTVSGWRNALGTNAETLQVANPADVYKGITDATIGGVEYAYLANFRTGTVDVMAGASGAPPLTGHFTDPNLPAGYAPFGIQRIGTVIYVTYAVQDATKHDDVPNPGNGIVDAFDLQGNLVHRLVTGGVLNSPWGLALAPAGFGDFGGDLLVGNFGDGAIHAFNPTTGALVGTLTGPGGTPLSIDGLWSLQFGNGGSAGPMSTLFFTAGPNGEDDGLFGELVAAPEPATWLMLGGAIALLMRRRFSTRN
jgi:uncharacterized protein (TIGR03118 family)